MRVVIGTLMPHAFIIAYRGDLHGTEESPQAEGKRNKGLMWDAISELEISTAAPSKLMWLRGCGAGINIC